jgi:hypothetical protein
MNMLEVEGLRGDVTCKGRGADDDEAADASAATCESLASSRYASFVTLAISSSCLTSARLEEEVVSSKTLPLMIREEGPGRAVSS